MKRASVLALGLRPRPRFLALARGRRPSSRAITAWSTAWPSAPTARLLATASFDNTVKLWDFAAGKELRTLKGHTGPVYCVAFSKDGTMLASSSLDKTIRLWNPADGKCSAN